MASALAGAPGRRQTVEIEMRVAFAGHAFVELDDDLADAGFCARISTIASTRSAG